MASMGSSRMKPSAEGISVSFVVCLAVILAACEGCVRSGDLEGILGGGGGPPTTAPPPAVWPGVQRDHLSYLDLTRFMREAASAYPHLASMDSIGQSVQGRSLWTLRVTNLATLGRDPLRPAVRFIGNVHGNEIVGHEVLRDFIAFLLSSYSTKPEVRELVDRTQVHVLLSMNPDGLDLAREHAANGGDQPGSPGDCLSNKFVGRRNANNEDLNRNFPDPHKSIVEWNDAIANMSKLQRLAFIQNLDAGGRFQPETMAVVSWTLRNDFLLSAAMHGAALVANYPLDDYSCRHGAGGPGPQGQCSSVSADDALYRRLAGDYAARNPPMARDICSDDSFPGGITNGADWSPVQGGLQDFGYLYGETLELTLELSCCKYPTNRTLRDYWLDNKLSLINFVQKAHMGVKGRVVGPGSLGLPDATVTLTTGGRAVRVRTNTSGYFWRVLLPGDYVITASKLGFTTASDRVQVNENAVSATTVTLTLASDNNSLG